MGKAEHSMLSQLHMAVYDLDVRVSTELHKNDNCGRDFAIGSKSGPAECRIMGFGQRKDGKQGTTSEHQNNVGGWWRGRSEGVSKYNALRQLPSREGCLSSLETASGWTSQATTVPVAADAGESVRGQTPLARRFGRKSHNGNRDAVFSSLSDPSS